MPDMERYGAALEAMEDRVHARVGEDCLVIYSAYETDADEIPIDNLDEVPICGAVRIRAKADPYWGGGRGRDYESSILESPTWLDLCAYANDQIRVTRDRTHRYLELIEVVGREGGVQIARFFMGS